MQDKIKTLLANALSVSVESISDDCEMRHMEAWDSLRHMEVVAAVEREFKVELTFEEIVAMRSARGIREVLRQRGMEDSWS